VKEILLRDSAGLECEICWLAFLDSTGKFCNAKFWNLSSLGVTTHFFLKKKNKYKWIFTMAQLFVAQPT
jgi:hypothetical protein